jgi:DNA polymerase phi
MAKKKRSASLQEDPEDEEENSDDEYMSTSEQEESPEHEGEIPFLDTFYGLASASPAERAQAAHAMLQHCLLGPSANSKDAAYCFKRLLNGLCSGRASARQGYASAFCSFLKIAYSTGALEEIQQETSDNTNESLLVFVRKELLKTTDPKQALSKKFGKAKGSEERDYQFGRLFGILSVVRSGILAPSGDNLLQVKQVSAGLVNDLVELYYHKKWMREPTAHGIVTLMNSLYQASKDSSDDAKVVLNHLVRESIVPKLFAGKAMQDFSAEQIAVAVSIQSHMDLFESSDLPAPLNQAILSASTIPTLSDALCATSTVVHPRSHIVWDMLWQFLTTESPSENGRVRILCKSCPVSDEPAAQVVKALMQSVVTESLLAIGTNGEGSNPTHERRALALSIVRAACGGQLNSSTAGPFVIATDAKLLENAILTPDIVKRLFLDIICAAGGSSKSAHMLKPLALHVLETIVDSDALSDVDSAESLDRRLSFAKTLLANDTRFDGRTKTATVSNLLLLNDSVEITYNKELGDMWTKYIDFVTERILRASLDAKGRKDHMQVDEEASRLSSHEALGYADLLFNAAKRILRLQVAIDDEERADFEKFRSSIVQRILGFLMASAYFDCSNLSDPDNKPKKKKGRKKSFDASSTHSVVGEGLRIKQYAASRDEILSTFPYSIRATLSSRFFSLLADCTAMASSAKPISEELSEKQGKDLRVLELLADIVDGWTRLEELGARSLGADAGVDEDDKDEVQSVNTAINAVKKMQQDALALVKQNVVKDDKEVARTKCTVGCTILASTLCLQFLRCGTSDEIVDEIDDDDDDDDEDIIEMITDLQDIPRNLLKSIPDEPENKEESVGLLGLAELCIHVLSGPFGASGLTRGASPKLLRDAVKFAWIGGLRALAAIASDGATLDDEVLSALLTAIGVSTVEESGDDDDRNSENEDDSDSDDGEEVKAVFSQAAGEAIGLDDEDSDVEMKEAINGSASDEEDVELDPAQLESMLLEDSDAILDDEDGIEVGELEHHAGADAALAKLIKLKQDTRKAGRQALERLEASKQLRCVILVDTLLSNPGQQWSNLLQAELFVKMVVPLLQTRRDLEKALEKSSANQLGKKSAGADSEKRALVERLTSLLKTKLCKIRWSKEIQADSTKIMEVATELMNQARRSNSTEQASCCSSSLLALVKTIADTEDLIKAASVYSEALAEWSTKRTTKLQTSLFDDLVQQLPWCVISFLFVLYHVLE